MPRIKTSEALPAAEVAAAQRLAGELAGELARIVLRLEELLSSLPRSEDEDAMLELRVPSDVPTEVRTIAECVIHDNLRPAILCLAKASKVTAEDLRREFRASAS